MVCCFTAEQHADQAPDMKSMQHTWHLEYVSPAVFFHQGKGQRVAGCLRAVPVHNHPDMLQRLKPLERWSPYAFLAGIGATSVFRSRAVCILNVSRLHKMSRKATCTLQQVW